MVRIAEAEVACGDYRLTVEWPVPTDKTDNFGDLASVALGQFMDFVGQGEDLDLTETLYVEVRFRNRLDSPGATVLAELPEEDRRDWVESGVLLVPGTRVYALEIDATGTVVEQRPDGRYHVKLGSGETVALSRESLARRP